MDLNQILYHHQMALMAVSQARRDGHLLPNFDLPRYYAKRINEYRERRGLADGFAAVIVPEHVGPKADPPFSEPATDYPVFVGDTLIAELLVNEALAMTEEERVAFGLEDVVGRLAAVQEDIWVIGRDIYRALDLDEDKLATLTAKLSALPDLNPAAAVHLQPVRSLSEAGIAHTYVEQFRVGPFRYSNIDDARAALRRQGSGSGAEGEQANDA
ncbi:hypothetical protein E5675_08965 [Sphingopyxis sp. PAMC25046]|uniref:hypothetical protein n=1 Tax=Sphingopyxis sp. PAMC25046 TaxID=2565556 RepID=UPI00109DD500|nr:hypothetical protein [Sphingopyxis sp. PAMC25046]QCB54553.1 hypothetical protein E5675_08965 [Sphingopyxis sp. PAMC25046]